MNIFIYISFIFTIINIVDSMDAAELGKKFNLEEGLIKNLEKS